MCASILPWCDMFLIVCGMLLSIVVSSIIVIKFRAICSLFGKCCVNIIASKCLFTLQQSFGIAHEIAVNIKLFCGLMMLSKSTFDALVSGFKTDQNNVKPLLFNEQRKCSYFDSCSNLASQTPVCGVLLIECPSCGHSSILI